MLHLKYWHQPTFITEQPNTLEQLDTLSSYKRRLDPETGEFIPSKRLDSERAATRNPAVTATAEITGPALLSYRFLVVHSTKLDGRKTKSLQKELSLREKELQKAIGQVEKQVFACEPDAKAALAEFKKQHQDDFFPLSGQIVSQEKRKPGRPGKNTPIEEVYYLKIQYTTDEDADNMLRNVLSVLYSSQTWMSRTQQVIS